MIHFHPSNPEIEKIFNRLLQYPGVSVEHKLAQDISRNKTIRLLRRKNHLFIGRDYNKHKTIIFFPPNVKVKKNGDNFFFEIF
jgi:hypothetical protein